MIGGKCLCVFVCVSTLWILVLSCVYCEVGESVLGVVSFAVVGELFKACCVYVVELFKACSVYAVELFKACSVTFCVCCRTV